MHLFSEMTGRIRSSLPRGSTLPIESWNSRHRAILAFGVFNALILPLYGMLLGYGFVHSVLEGAAILPLLAIGLVAGRREHRRAASSAASLALLTASAVSVHLSGGVTEAHFHFFVVIVVLTLYEDWTPFFVALGFVIVHHGLGSLVDANALYSHPDAEEHKWRWAGIHAGFVAAAGIAGVSTWKHNEDARSRAAAAEKKAADLYRAVVESLTEGVVVRGPGGVIRTANSSAGRILRTTSEKLIGTTGTADHQPRVREDGRPWGRDESPAAVVSRTGRSRTNDIVGVTGDDGEITWLSMTTRPLELEEGGWSVVSSFSDVTEPRRAKAELEHLAERDPLTGLVNRRRLEANLTRDLAAIGRYGTTGAVLVLDLDNFKDVNDSLGHATGDELIRRAAEVIAGRMRSSDTAARLGGDEFAVILPQADGPAADQAASALLRAIREQAVIDTPQGPRHATASVGVATMAPGMTAADVMARGDKAMYHAKDHGKDRVSGFDRAGNLAAV